MLATNVGSSLQQDIRAGDQIVQVNGTSVEVLALSDIQHMLEHANSNQIHLTCVPYRETQAQPVVVTVKQADSSPSLIPSKSQRERGSLIIHIDSFQLAEMDVINEDDPRARPIAVGQETLIEIDRGQSGLGLSVVGGSDTQLVSDTCPTNDRHTTRNLLVF